MLSALEPFLSSSPKSSIAGKGYGTRNGARPRRAETHGLQQPAQDKPLAMYYCLIAPNPPAQGPMSTAVSLMVFATRAEPCDSALEFRIDKRDGPPTAALARQIADR